MTVTRRSFLAGLGAVSVGLLFQRKLDAVLESLERDHALELVSEPQVPGQAPAAADIVVRPQAAFRPERLVVNADIAKHFVIEDIRVGILSQFATGISIPAGIFSPQALKTDAARLALSTAAPGTDIRFRVRHVGKDPAGARFQAVLIGACVGVSGLVACTVLPIDSGVAIVATS